LTSRLADLHLHSTFSFLDAYGLPSQIVARAKELGRSAIALTDHGSTSGHALLEKECLAAGIKPIFGCEFYVVGSLKSNSQKKMHLTVLAKNQKGYSNLLKLASESYYQGFYYRPTIDGNLLAEYGEDLIILSGCANSPISKALEEQGQDEACRIIRNFQTHWGEDFYLEIQPVDYGPSQKLNEFLQWHGGPLVLTNDVHFIIPEQNKIRTLLWSIRDRSPIHETPVGPATEYQLTYEEMLAFAPLGHITSEVAVTAAERSLEIADKCDVKLPRAQLIRFPLPEGWDNKTEYLRHLTLEGMKRRGIIDDTECRERAEYEFGLIQEKEYEDYFLIVADMVNWAKEHDVLVGPARGSAAGSLVCYALRITEVNPLQWDLMFERFIDITRLDLPDIDLDFQDDKRVLVKQYLRDKYGADCVGTLATFTTFKGKNSLDEVGKSFNVPMAEVLVVKNLLVERSGGDSRAGFTIEDTIATFERAKEVVERWPALQESKTLEGQYRNSSTHAAGMVISEGPLADYMAIYWREGEEGSKEALASYDYDGCGYIGLVKIDVLGLSALTRLHQMLEALDKDSEFLYNLPLDDEQTLEAFRKQNVLGIFQFEGDATRSVFQQMADVKNFGELVDVNALSRPGPLHGGSTTAYIENRRRPEETKKPCHILLKEQTKDTQYQILYQEQVLRISREIGGLSWRDTSDLRKAMSRSLGMEFFNKYRDAFADGAEQLHGIIRPEAMKLFDTMCTHGSWSFNRSHSVSYTYIGWWLMWFKAHHPQIFYWATINNENDDSKLRMYLSEYLNHGGKLLAPKINRSVVGWTIEGNNLRAGFSSLEGVGEKTADLMVAGQPYADKEDFINRKIKAMHMRKGVPTEISKKPFNIKHIKMLEEAGCFDETAEEEDFMGLHKEMELFSKLPRSHRIGDLDFGPKMDGVVLVGRLKERNLRNMFETGVVAKRMRYNQNTGQMEPGTVKNPELADWVNLSIEDETGVIVCTVDRYAYPKLRKQVWEELAEGMLIQVSGWKSHGFKKLQVAKIVALEGQAP